jgi:HEAT repeat protein
MKDRHAIGPVIELLQTSKSDAVIQHAVEALAALGATEALPAIREIARRWNVEASIVHHEYARAREEFREHLRGVVVWHSRGAPEAARREWESLLEAFS